MDTVVQPPSDAELHLLTDWGDPGQRGRTRTAAVVSVAAHAAAIGILMLLPSEFLAPPPRQEVHRTITPLVEPLTELTQKAPNTGKITKEFSAADVEPRPRVHVAPTPPPAPKPAPPKAAVIPPMPVPKAAAPAPVPEPPKVEAAAKEPPKIELPQTQAPPPPPQIQQQEKPKVTFENVPPPPGPVAPGHSQVPIPGNGVADAVRQATRGGGTGGLTIGDGGISGAGAGISLPPTSPSQRSNIQLLSDPLGVDFTPYLTQILATVRRNWKNVIPESVVYGGRRGAVAIQFSITHDGKVAKLVIAEASGSDPLDRAAVAGISASNPFPPLPAEFKGERIVLQFNFSYNMPRK
jgi:TonB family protein